MHFNPAFACSALASNSQHISSTNNLPSESREPFISISAVRNTDVSSETDDPSEGWSTSTKVTVIGGVAIVAIGTVITAVGQGNPVTGAVALGSLAAGYFGMQPSSSVAAVPEILPVPIQHVGEQAPVTRSINTCNRLITTTSAMNGQRIDEISLTELQSVKTKIENVSTLDLNTLSSQQLNELGTCFGTNLMAGKISSLKTRLENAQREINEGGELSDRIFGTFDVLRRDLLLAEVNSRLAVVNEIHEKIRSFVIRINDRILSDLG